MGRPGGLIDHHFQFLCKCIFRLKKAAIIKVRAIGCISSSKTRTMLCSGAFHFILLWISYYLFSKFYKIPNSSKYVGEGQDKNVKVLSIQSGQSGQTCQLQLSFVYTWYGKCQFCGWFPQYVNNLYVNSRLCWSTSSVICNQQIRMIKVSAHNYWDSFKELIIKWVF